MKRLTSLLIGCSLTLAGAALAQQPAEQQSPSNGSSEPASAATPGAGGGHSYGGSTPVNVLKTRTKSNQCNERTGAAASPAATASAKHAVNTKGTGAQNGRTTVTSQGKKTQQKPTRSPTPSR